MALTKDPVDIDRRPPSSGGLELRLSRLKAQVTGLRECGKKLEETSKSLQRTHRTLAETQPLTGRADSDAAVAGALSAFPWALTRVTAKLGVVEDAPMTRTATPAEAVAGGIAALQRLGMRARLYAEELQQAQIQLIDLEFGSEAYRRRLRGQSERLLPLTQLLREFGVHCDTLSYNLQPARYQMEEALNGLDAIGIGRAALSHLTRADSGAVTAVYADQAAVERFLAEHPEHRNALHTYVTRAAEAYAHAEDSRDQLADGLERVQEAVEAV